MNLNRNHIFIISNIYLLKVKIFVEKLIILLASYCKMEDNCYSCILLSYIYID